MNELDSRIQAALNAATELPDNLPEPSVTEELLQTFHGKNYFLMRWALVKGVAAASLMLFCIWQYFQQDSTMAQLAYASATILCAVAYAAVALFIWIQAKHDATMRQVKRVELQLAMLARQLQNQTAHQETKES